MKLSCRVRVAGTALVAASSLGACGYPTVCTLELRTAIALTVVDAITGAPAAGGATVVVRSAGFRDSVVLSPTAAGYSVGEDRAGAGTYEFVVRKPGYQEWIRSGVRVRADQCHVTEPAQLTAALQPLSR